MDFEKIEKAKADLKLINKVESQVLAAYEQTRRNIRMLEALRRGECTDEEWLGRRNALINAREVLKRLPTPEYLGSVRIKILSRVMAV